MHIQIWTGSIGGHRRIAEALAWALTAARPATRVRVVDVYSSAVVDGRFAAVVNLYDRLVAGAPALWRAVYGLSNRAPALRAVRWVGARFTPKSALRRALKEPPAVLVNVISDLGQVGALARAAPVLPPVVTVVSDLVSVHRAWVTREAGLIITPTEAAYDACRALGAPADRLVRLGFPIRSHLFCRAGEPNGNRREGVLRVLVMGGSSGAGRVMDDMRALLGAGLPLAVTVVCGKNKRLRRRVSALAEGQPQVTVLGYARDVAELMRGADVLLTKAGPSTVFEAAAVGLPAVITGHLPGQEEGNAAFFTGAGVAVAAPTTLDTVRLLRGFSEDPGRLKKLRNPALRRETCAAAGRIAAAILECAEAQGARPLSIQQRG